MDLGNLSPLQNAFLGCVAGIAEVTSTQPFVYGKNAIQQGLSLSLNPRVLFRGFPANCANMCVTTTLQFPLTSLASRVIRMGHKREMSSLEEISSAAIGGALSGPACSVFELIMIQQQRFAGSLVTSIGGMKLNFGARIFFRGVLPTVYREAGYSMGYLGLAPVLTKSWDSKMDNASVWSALVAGVFAGFVTHPFDTAKTIMQGDLAGGRMTQVMNDLHQREGIQGFYRGFSFRTATIVVGFFIIGQVKERLPTIAGWV